MAKKWPEMVVTRSFMRNSHFNQSLLTKIVSISLGQSMSISLTHIRQTSLSSGGTKELHKVKSLVAISPMSFQRAKMCLQSGPFDGLELFVDLDPETGDVPEVASEAISGFKDIDDEVEDVEAEAASLPEPLLSEEDILLCWILGDLMSSAKIFKRSIS